MLENADKCIKSHLKEFEFRFIAGSQATAEIAAGAGTGIFISTLS